jgi:hypothetical protein
LNYIIFVLDANTRMPTPTTITPSLAAGITLAPVRLADLVAKPPTVTGVTETKSGYLPPHLRRTVEPAPKPQPSSIEITDSDFPTLGGPPKKSAPSVAKINFKKAVDDHLEREKQSEIERANGVEEDTLKLTSSQLEADGWAILSLKSVVVHTDFNDDSGPTADILMTDEIHRAKRFSEEMEEEAERFFRAYMKISHPDDEIKIVKKIKTPTPLNDACMRYRAKMRSLTSVKAV